MSAVIEKSPSLNFSNYITITDYLNFSSALFSRIFFLFFSVLSTWKAWVVLDVTMVSNRKQKLSTPMGNCTIQNVLCKYKSRSFLQRQKVITSKSSSKNLSKCKQTWHFYTLFVLKTTKTEILWRIFWRDNCQSIIGAVENFRYLILFHLFCR